MARVTVAKLQPGAQLIKDVENVHGMLMIPKGTALMERHIELLNSWGIESVYVASPGADAESAGESMPSPEVLAFAEEQLKPRLRHVHYTIPAARVLKQMAIVRLGRTLAGKSDSSKQ